MRIFNILLCFLAFSYNANTKDLVATKNRLFFNMEAMFSAEFTAGYERRHNDLLGTNVGVRGGTVMISLQRSFYDLGMQVYEFFYANEPTAQHQFFAGPGLELSFGKATTNQSHGDPREFPIAVVSAPVAGGYRYNFIFPLSLDVGLGAHLFSMAMSLKDSWKQYYPAVAVFARIGISYRF
jgi:hypothetical protein